MEKSNIVVPRQNCINHKIVQNSRYGEKYERMTIQGIEPLVSKCIVLQYYFKSNCIFFLFKDKTKTTTPPNKAIGFTHPHTSSSNYVTNTNPTTSATLLSHILHLSSRVPLVYPSTTFSPIRPWKLLISQPLLSFTYLPLAGRSIYFYVA